MNLKTSAALQIPGAAQLLSYNKVSAQPAAGQSHLKQYLQLKRQNTALLFREAWTMLEGMEGRGMERMLVHNDIVVSIKSPVAPVMTPSPNVKPISLRGGHLVVARLGDVPREQQAEGERGHRSHDR